MNSKWWHKGTSVYSMLWGVFAMAVLLLSLLGHTEVIPSLCVVAVSLAVSAAAAIGGGVVSPSERKQPQLPERLPGPSLGDPSCGDMVQ